LISLLESQGHEIFTLVRKPDPKENEIAWSPDAGAIEATKLDGLDAVVHLAGENIFGRWTEGKKNRIYRSRVAGTRLVCEAIAGLANPPKVMVCASAVGIYGDRGDVRLVETSDPGDDFLARVCKDWEAATEPAARKGVRVVNTRFGVVLSAKGGALAMMRVPFKLGVGGTLGSGKQYMPWIALDDVAAAIQFALANESLRGPVNVVAPEQVTNREFTKTMGRILRRPTFASVPLFAMRLLFAEMADALTASQPVEPRALLASGFTYQYPQLEDALRHELS
jgi:hypothetical protein